MIVHTPPPAGKVPIDPADFKGENGWGIFEELDRALVARKYPRLYERIFPPTSEELAKLEARRREAVGLPPKESLARAQAFALLLLDYRDISAPVVRDLLQSMEGPSHA